MSNYGDYRDVEVLRKRGSELEAELARCEAEYHAQADRAENAERKRDEAKARAAKAEAARLDADLQVARDQKRIAELEVQRAPTPGMAGTLRDKNTLLEYKDTQLAKLQERVKELETEIERELSEVKKRVTDLEAQINEVQRLREAENRMTADQIERARKAEARIVELEHNVGTLTRGKARLQELYDSLKAKGGT